MKNIHFLSEITLQPHMLQSNPHFSCSQKSEKIPEYSLDLDPPPCAKIFHSYLEYLCYRKSFLFWTEMVVSTTTTILLAPFDLNFLVHLYLSNLSLASKAQLQTPSHLTTVTSPSYWPETYLVCENFSTAPGSKPNRGNTQNYHEQHARHWVFS